MDNTATTFSSDRMSSSHIIVQILLIDAKAMTLGKVMERYSVHSPTPIYSLSQISKI